MKTLTFLLTIILLVPVTFATTKQNSPEILNQEERWKALMDLVNKEIQTIKGNKYSGPELKHRLFELYSEKIKLIRQKENEVFLKNPGKKTKSDSFKSSLEQFKTAELYGVTVIKKYPEYKKNNHIYYSMAMNSRDFDESKNTERFLLEAVKLSRNDKEILYNSKVGLAEHYYNNKKYFDAISYYQEVLKETNNEWYAKHLFNAGWCYLKQRDFKTALNHVLMSFEASKNPKIVSMNDQIMNAAGLFFVQADEITNGIRFYEKNAKDPSFYLTQMAKYSQSKNNFSQTDEILKAALQDAKKKNNIQAQVDVHQTQLDIYRENKKIDMFFTTAESLKSIYLNKQLSNDDQFTTTNKIKEFAGFLQVNLVKDKNKEKIDYNKDELRFIIAFFDILTVLDSKQTNLYNYYQAESFLSVRDFKGAYRYYQKSILVSKKDKNITDITKKSIESMLATLEYVKLKKNSEEKVVTFAIKNFLILYPKDEKSQLFYQKLFSIYFNKKQLNKALNVLVTYIHNYAEDIKVHREMLTQILEYRISKKQTNKIAFWVNKIDAGYLSFESDYIQKSIRILGKLLFEKYQSLEKQGKIAEALEGYESIFENKKYPKQTKAESAFAIAQLMIQQNKSEDSFEWLKDSMEMYDPNELDKISDSLIQLSKGYRLLQNFKFSSDTAQIVIDKYCSKEVDEKYSAIEIILENTMYDTKSQLLLDSFLSKYSNCSLKEEFTKRMTLKAFNYALFTNNKDQIISIYKNNNTQADISRLFNQYLSFEVWERNDLESIFKDVTTDERLSKNENKLLKVKEVISRIENTPMNLEINNDVEFNEEEFNTKLEERFNFLNAYTLEAQKIIKESNVTEAYMIKTALQKKTLELSIALGNLKAHPIMDKNYAEGFIGQMQEFSMELNKKSEQLKAEAKLSLDKNSHFTLQAKPKVIKEITSDDQIQNLFLDHSSKAFLSTMDKKINLNTAK